MKTKSATSAPKPRIEALIAWYPRGDTYIYKINGGGWRNFRGDRYDRVIRSAAIAKDLISENYPPSKYDVVFSVQ